MESVVTSSAHPRTASYGDLMVNLGVVAVLAVLTAVYAVPLGLGPLYSPKRDHAFGMVEQGRRLEHSFSVRNVHPWPIWINGISTTCGCTSAIAGGQKPPLRLGPYQATVITCVLETGSTAGTLEKQISVSTSGGGVLALTVRAAVK